MPSWTPPPHPPREPIEGRFCTVQPVDERFAPDLFTVDSCDVEGRTWTYLSYGPFVSESDYRLWLKEMCFSPDPLFHAIVCRREGRATGLAAFMRIAPASGSIEVGGIHFSPLLQRTPAATEAMYLMMRRAFELGYRRYEWKCDALNTPSRIAAQRLGFSFEGIFRQATVYKGRSRDTAWYAVIDRDWPMLKQAFDTWLNACNFDEAGRQRLSLTDMTRPLLHRVG
jgi:RimJ/RimL family protein N-acetyltransferase